MLDLFVGNRVEIGFRLADDTVLNELYELALFFQDVIFVEILLRDGELEVCEDGVEVQILTFIFLLILRD